jgi:predicted RNA-binding Zn-ribbon protein involved in translation (DUF1610 family)
MGLFDIFRRPIRKAMDPSMVTVAAVNRAYANPGYRKYYATEPQRKAIATVSRYNSIYGIPRPGYDKALVDTIAENVIYGMIEKRCIDYTGATAITVENRNGDTVDSALDFLRKPNPQDTFSSLLKATIPDIMRSDAGCWVKTPDSYDLENAHIVELRAYAGDEFWPELDRGFVPIEGTTGQASYGVYSHGYVTKWWQHSGPGIYVPYDPAEVCYIRMYPRSNGPWGTCLLQRLRWYLECLDDGTKAAGMTFANGIMPALEWNHGNLQGPEQLAELRADREEQHQGPENFGGIIDTFEGDTLKPLTPTMVDLQWLEGQQHLSQIVWAYYGFPASEFVQGDVNRATAYIARNITKSSVLAPLLHTIEEMINCYVLPDLEGYRPDWKFSFVSEPDLDDELKQVQINQGRQQTAMGWYQMGVPLVACLKLAGLPEEDIEAVKKEQLEGAEYDRLPGEVAGTGDGPLVEQYGGTDGQQGYQGSDDEGGGSRPRMAAPKTVCPHCGHEWDSKASGSEITCPRCGKGFSQSAPARAA